jgi:hypothetical protein
MVKAPYETSGQELGETRKEMTKRLMKDVEDVINKYKNLEGKYYILVHAKPWPNFPTVIKIKLIPMNVKPKMMLSCILFGVDNSTGTLTIEWVLPGNWPTWSCEGTNEPVPETIGSINELGLTYDLDRILAY